MNFAEGRLAPRDVVSVEAHLADCADCCRIVAVSLDQKTDGTHAATVKGGPGSVRPPLSHGLAHGTIGERYTLLGLAGRGGMGEVYAAYDAKMDRKIALKLLRADDQDAAPVGRARLLREARLLARLSHPNVVAVHDAGTFAGRVFVAMDYVDGGTLKDWIARQPRTRAEILAAFTQAAHGLAAAHAVGLVHRDFKPANVMVTKTGDVRVTDFGLARQMDERGGTEIGRRTRSRALADLQSTALLSLTVTGTIVGTPRYMAPEQLLGQATDGRTDQFSFCVALYDALYGAPPFGEGGFEEMRAEVIFGRVRPAPPGSSVPAWLRAVLLRGLAVSPDRRWPSMNALVAALGRDPARARRRRAGAAGVMLVVGLSALTLTRGARTPASLCQGGPARLASVWQADTAFAARRNTIRRAFLNSGDSAAPDVWERVASGLDRYAARWLNTYREACEATHVLRAQTAALLDLRMTCLEERRTALTALTSVFASADRGTVESAVDAVNALPPLEPCSNEKLLQAHVEPPGDEGTRRRVDALRARGAAAKALNDTGKHSQAIGLWRDLLVEARETRYKPVIVEQLVGLADAMHAGTLLPEAVPALTEATWLGLATGREELAAEAAVELVYFEGAYQAHHERGAMWANLARAILDRLGDDHDLLRAWLLNNESVLATDRNDPENALALIRRSIALKEKALPPNHPDLAASLNVEAEALAKLGRFEEALTINQRVLPMFVQAYGPVTVEAALTLSNRGEYLIALVRPAEALEPLRQSLDIWERDLGPENPLLAYPLTATGRALTKLGRAREALPSLERARRLRESDEQNARLVADTRFALAVALCDARADRTRAMVLATDARDAYARVADRARAAEVETWLAENRPARRTRP